VAGAVFGFQDLPPGYMCWLLDGLEGPEPRLSKSCDTHNLFPSYLAGQGLKALRSTSGSYMPACVCC
jgi:hypothetical protein